MRIIGIDPGTVVMGYGIIEARDDKVSLVKCGALKNSGRSPIGERLSYFYEELLKIISLFGPEAAAVEQPFVAKNVRSALAIGRAQAVAILAAAGKGLPVFEYTPATIKQKVADYGASSKEQIQEMVRLQLGLSEVPRPADAADAIAVALCHVREMQWQNLIARSTTR